MLLHKINIFHLNTSPPHHHKKKDIYVFSSNNKCQRRDSRIRNYVLAILSHAASKRIILNLSPSQVQGGGEPRMNVRNQHAVGNPFKLQ